MSGWGGRRVGSGPKPKTKAPKENPFAVHQGGKDELLEPPATLSADQQEFWRKWAPLALKRGTLIPENVPGFELLCEMAVRRVALGVLVDALNPPSPEPLRLFAQYSKQVEGLMGRFRLAPFGKAEVAEKPKSAVNPFAFTATKVG